MPVTEPTRSAVRLLRGLLRPYRRRIAFAAAFTLAGCLLTLAVPLLVQQLVESIASQHSLPLPLVATALVLTVVAQGSFGLATTFIMGRVALDIVCQLRRHIYDRLLRAEARVAPGVILSRLTDDVTCIQNLVSAQTVGVFTDLATALVGAGWLLWHSPALFLVAAAFIPLVAIHFRSYSPRIRAGAAEVRERLDGIFVQLKEKLDGAVVVKCHGRELAEEIEFEARMDDVHAPRVRLGRLTNGFATGGQLLAGAGAAAVFLAGIAGVMGGHLSPGEVVAAAALTALLFGPVGRLTDVASLYEQAVTSGERLVRLMERTPKAVVEPVQPIPLERAQGRIEFDAVGFGYQAGQSVLQDVRLCVEPGERVAIVGPTGCGKSTLLSLLLRFHDPARGEIRLDGISLRDLSLADLRRQIGVVPQDPVVFRGTLADNIRYGCPDVGMERVEAAVRIAGAESLVTRLPHGYATVIGEGGYPLSAGERQRIAIARAVCLDPPVVLLDEATSNLDPAAEAEIQASLAGMLRGRTAIIVAHRLATVRDADRIVVLDGGRVVQSGPHVELLRDSTGLYHRFVTRQFGEAIAV